MGEEQPQYPYPYRTDALENPVYSTAAGSDASATPSTPTAYARSFGTHSASLWDRSAYGYLPDAPTTGATMPPPMPILSSPQSLSPVSSPPHRERRHPRRSATFDLSGAAERPRAPRRGSTRGPYPDSSQPPRPLRPILPAPPSPLIASEQPSYGAHALAAPSSSRSAYPQLPPTPVYNWTAAPVTPLSLGSVPPSPGSSPGYSGGRPHPMPSLGNYETPSNWQAQYSSTGQGAQGSTADAVHDFANSGASATPDVNHNGLPLTFSNLAIWNGEKNSTHEPPAQDLVPNAPSAIVSAQQIVARQTLAASALAFIDDFKWMSEAERHYLKELIIDTPQWLKDSSRTPGQVGSLFTTVHSDGPEQRYRWRFSDVPGSTDQLVSDLPDGHEVLESSPRERWVRRTALHHAAIAIITFSVSCLEAMPAGCDLHSWVHSSLAQITEQAGRVTQAIKAEMQGWSGLRPSSAHPLKVESRAWWFGSEFNDPTWRGTGNRPARVVTGSTGRTQESVPQAADRLALTRR